MARPEFIEDLCSNPDALVIWDTEFTAWPGSQERGWTGPGEHREIVQIGAIALNAAADFAEIAAFECIIRPKINPELSAYFVDLTGITQERVDREGNLFPHALDAFGGFVNRWAAGRIASFGRDDLVLNENFALHRIAVPIALHRFHDLRPALETALGRTGLMSCELPRFFGLAVPEQGHDALGDARAIASVLRHLALGGEK